MCIVRIFINPYTSELANVVTIKKERERRIKRAKDNLHEEKKRI